MLMYFMRVVFNFTDNYLVNTFS